MLRYARYFAEPAFYPFVEGMPEFPQIFELRKEPDMTVNVGGAWHSDTTYLDKPPIGTMLYAREVPAFGGDTMVANQYLAYEALSPGMRGDARRAHRHLQRPHEWRPRPGAPKTNT